MTTHDPTPGNPEPTKKMRRRELMHLLYDNGWTLGRNEKRYLWRCPCGGSHDIESIRSPADQKLSLRMIDMCQKSLAQEVNG